MLLSVMIHFKRRESENMYHSLYQKREKKKQMTHKKDYIYPMNCVTFYIVWIDKECILFIYEI